jgi:ribosomal protein L40E
MLGIGGGLCTLMAFIFIGSILGVPLLILMVIGFFFIVRAFIQGRHTRYFLTNERLIETRNGIITKEVSLDKFKDKPLSQFVEKKAVGTVNNQPVYKIRIYDPVSADLLMELKDLDETSIRAFEAFVQTIKCPYCGAKNPVNSLDCRNGGASL